MTPLYLFLLLQVAAAVLDQGCPVCLLEALPYAA
jgi:hypothetical protein